MRNNDYPNILKKVRDTDRKVSLEEVINSLEYYRNDK